MASVDSLWPTHKPRQSSAVDARRLSLPAPERPRPGALAGGAGWDPAVVNQWSPAAPTAAPPLRATVSPPVSGPAAFPSPVPSVSSSTSSSSLATPGPSSPFYSPATSPTSPSWRGARSLSLPHPSALQARLISAPVLDAATAADLQARLPPARLSGSVSAGRRNGAAEAAPSPLLPPIPPLPWAAPSAPAPYTPMYRSALPYGAAPPAPQRAVPAAGWGAPPLPGRRVSPLAPFPRPVVYPTPPPPAALRTPGPRVVSHPLTAAYRGSFLDRRPSDLLFAY